MTAIASDLWYPTHTIGDLVDTDTVRTIRNHFGGAIGSPVHQPTEKIMFQISSLAVDVGETNIWIGT